MKQIVTNAFEPTMGRVLLDMGKKTSLPYSEEWCLARQSVINVTRISVQAVPLPYAEHVNEHFVSQTWTTKTKSQKRILLMSHYGSSLGSYQDILTHLNREAAVADALKERLRLAEDERNHEIIKCQQAYNKAEVKKDRTFLALLRL